MKCPYCGFQESRVIDSRSAEEGSAIKRRRECSGCAMRFTTYEKVDQVPLIVIKSDGRREFFDRDKIIKGLLTAGVKREIPLETFEDLVNDVERELLNSFVKEVKSSQLGKMVLERLQEIDEVAYVRFASVYRKFKGIESFKEELDTFNKPKKSSLWED